MKYIFLFLFMALALTADAQRGKRVKKAIKERIEQRRTKPKLDTIPYEPPAPAPQAGEPPFNIDTVVINNLTLKARDWAYITANVDLNTKDSTSWTRMRNVRTQILAINPQSWNVDVLVNNLPGQWIVNIYEHLRLLTAGKLEQLHPTTLTNVKAKTNLQFWFDEIDAQFPASYIRDRDQGKHILLDQ